MIHSFQCKETETLWRTGHSRKIPHTIQRSALRKLHILNASTSILDLKIPPSNHLEKLKGELSPKYSIRINGQYRLIFLWLSDNASEIAIIDYH